MNRKMSMMTAMLLVLSLMTSLFSVGAAPLVQTVGGLPAYLDPSKSAKVRAADLLARMTIEERAGQMIQSEKGNITPEEVKQYFIGSALSGGGSFPNGKQQDSTRENWQTLIDSYQDGALSTRLGIPLLYGVDGVHGHNNVKGATLFPHNFGLGAANNAELVMQIGAATAKEIRSTSANWDFAPTIAAPQDIRWAARMKATAAAKRSRRRLAWPISKACRARRRLSAARRAGW